MINIKFYTLVGLLFVATSVAADGEAYIPVHPQSPQASTAPKTDAELDAAIRQVIQEINEKLTRIDGKIKEVQAIMDRIDRVIADLPKKMLCEAFSASARDIQEIEGKLSTIPDANERKRAEDRLNILKAVQNEQDMAIKEKRISCNNQ